MSRRHDQNPGWVYAAAPLGTMISFLVWAIISVAENRWFWVAAAAVGICTTAGMWHLQGILREEITALKAVRVHDAYKIQNLELQIKRERAWRN